MCVTDKRKKETQVSHPNAIKAAPRSIESKGRQTARDIPDWVIDNAAAVPLDGCVEGALLDLVLCDAVAVAATPDIEWKVVTAVAVSLDAVPLP
jgi:hypothetical protein